MSIPAHLKAPYIPAAMPLTPAVDHSLSSALLLPAAFTLSPVMRASSSFTRGASRPSVPPDQVAPAMAMRKRKCEVLQVAPPSCLEPLSDPDQFTATFRDLLRSAPALPADALENLTCNLMARRAGDEAFTPADLHLMMDVLVSERDGLSDAALQEALRGLLAGLGGTGIRPELLAILVRRVCAMGLGTPGRSLIQEVATLTACLVRGPARLARLQALADHLMDQGAGLHPHRLATVWRGMAAGLRSVSSDPDRVDMDLHERLLERILHPAPHRVGYQVRAALTGLWEYAFQPQAFTDELRNTILNQVFAGANAAGGRNMYSACAIATHWLCGSGDTERHREAVLGTLVRESVWLDESVIEQAASGLGWGLGGNRIPDERLEWLVSTLARWQAVHPQADWTAILSGLEVQLGHRALDERGAPRLPRPAPDTPAVTQPPRAPLKGSMPRPGLSA